MAFKASEIAEITVNGMRFLDWESVQVHLIEGGPSHSYRLQTTEGAPFSKSFAALRIKPGDHCTVTLAGERAIAGFVTTRQVAYTGNQHGVEIVGNSYSEALAYGSAMTKTSEFKNKSFTEIAQDLVNPYGLNFKAYGPLSQKKFERLNIAPGESVWNTLDMLARMRKVVLGSDDDGNLRGRALGSPIGGGDMLIEGVNILEGREVISIAQGTGIDYSSGQNTGSDERSDGTTAARPAGQQSSDVQGQIGSQGVHSPANTLVEHPGGKQDAQSRAEFESAWRGYEQINVQIVVQGWLRPSGGLWRPGQSAYVKSPMLIMDRELILNAVTFSQDDRGGSRSTLELSKESRSTGPDYSSQGGQ